MSLSSECCMLSGKGLCVGLITRPEGSYRVWCVRVWSRILENEEALANWGLLGHGEKTVLRGFLNKGGTMNFLYIFYYTLYHFLARWVFWYETF